jgi:Ca-activated chloride channel homolog
MKTPDEHELTAYLVDEVDARTAAAIEAVLRDDPELRAEADEIRQTAQQVKEALAAEPVAALPDEQRRAILAHANAVAPPRRAVGFVALAGLAATLTLAVAGYFTTMDTTLDEPLAKSMRSAPEPFSDRPGSAVPLGRELREHLKALGYTDGRGPFNTEGYAYRADNDFLEVGAHPLSTFGMDVDTASYANVRRYLNRGQLPPVDAVRVEEMVNYFTYDYPASRDGVPFAAHVEVGPAPWDPAHRLVRIGLKAREVAAVARPASNLVFLVDVSGSMSDEAKLPLVQRSLRLLVDRLDERDRVAIVVYAGAAGLVLPPTPGDQKARIAEAIDRLSAGGSTNGGQGIQLAYDTAARQRIPGGVNRVILATDGDFNVGLTDQGGLVRLIQEKAKEGVFLSALGFGMGNYKDDTLELLADKGNGNYAYIDSLAEARRALVEQMLATLITVAKDAKVQVEFNPAHVRSYRLIGYENRLLRPEEFADDTKDGGEVGAGHTVTALYELVPSRGNAPAAPPLRYQGARTPGAAADGGELLTVSVRYKEPEGETSRLLSWPVADTGATLDDTSPDFRFAAGVAAFGMLLRDSPHRGQASAAQVVELARSGLDRDAGGYRGEFLSLVHAAQPLLAARSSAPQR